MSLLDWSKPVVNGLALTIGGLAAIRSDRFEYIDFMLAHGAYINAGFPAPRYSQTGGQMRGGRCYCLAASPIPRSALAGSGALREAVAADSIELAP